MIDLPLHLPGLEDRPDSIDFEVRVEWAEDGEEWIAVIPEDGDADCWE